MSYVEQPAYIARDPVHFMHRYADRRDRELAGFLAATLAWGRRDIVMAKMEDLLQRMGDRPWEFIAHFQDRDQTHLEDFRHRTFNGQDMYWFIKVLSSIVQQEGGFEAFWQACHRQAQSRSRELLAVFHDRFFGLHEAIPSRMRKHLSSPERNSACKRLCLFLRWSVRNNSAVDTGIMDFISPSQLMIPLDTHVARQARRIGLLGRRQNDWKAVTELTGRLRWMAPDDPVKYDFALFGLGLDPEGVPEELVLNPGAGY